MEDDLKRSRQKGKGDPSKENAKNNYDHRANEIEKENTKFVKNQQQITKENIENQDIQLGQLDIAVDRLHVIAKVVEEETRVQNIMLDDLGRDLDDAGNKMGIVMGSLSKLLQTKDGCQIWTIVILAVILIILVALIIWV